MIEPIIRTYKNILLKGKYLKTQSKSCVVFVPGLGGTFDNIGKAVADTCIKEGYSFIWAKNQSCYIIYNKNYSIRK